MDPRRLHHHVPAIPARPFRRSVTGHAVRLTSDASAEVIAATQIYPPYLEDGAGMGTELVAKFREAGGAGDTIYECLSFEDAEPMDKGLQAYQDEIGGAFFGICQRVFDFVKAR